MASIEALAAAGANLNARGASGETPLHVAVTSSLEALRALLASGASPHASDIRGATPLHLAAATNQPDAVNALLKAGALVGARDLGGDTPIEALGRMVRPGAAEASGEGAVAAREALERVAAQADSEALEGGSSGPGESSLGLPILDRAGLRKILASSTPVFVQLKLKLGDMVSGGEVAGVGSTWLL